MLPPAGGRCKPLAGHVLAHDLVEHALRGADLLERKGGERLRSFVYGAVLGASAAVAAARRRRPGRAVRRETPIGLAAFEEAPCYRELVEFEQEREEPAGR